MSAVLMREAPVSPETTYAICYRTCGHRKEVTLEEYFAAACKAPHYHAEDKFPEIVYWTLTYPNADCSTCSPAEKEYWCYNVGTPPNSNEPNWFYGSNYGWLWQMYRERLDLAQAMLASASQLLGRKVGLGDLFALVGQQAEVRASDYGCSGDRISWTDEATITELRPPSKTPVYDEEYGTLRRHVVEPVFTLTGSGLCYTRLLSEIKLIGANN